jgi:hypothetical protein
MFDPQFHLRMSLFLRQINPQKSAKLELSGFAARNLPQLLKKITIFHGGLPVGPNRRLKLENCDERLSLIGRPPFKFQQLLGHFPTSPPTSNAPSCSCVN